MMIMITGQKMEAAGLIYDDSRHYLDHLAPFCSLMGWPLCVCEPEVADRAERYYPDLDVHRIDLWDLTLPETLVTCDTRPLLRASLGTKVEAVKTFLWLPHGNSDKGRSAPFFDALREGEIALVYGQKMLDFMQEQGVFPPFLRIGNFRRLYAEKHRSFYDALLDEVGILEGSFLYAPTWDDAEEKSSLWQALPHLIEKLPENAPLLIKIHPNTSLRESALLETWIGRYERAGCKFLIDFPPIYPLLKRCRAYLGDRSSIGYDFLSQNRPLFFLKTTPLSSCGKVLSLGEIGSFFACQEEKGAISRRQELYDYTFDATADWQAVAFVIRSLHLKGGG